MPTTELSGPAVYDGQLRSASQFTPTFNICCVDWVFYPTYDWVISLKLSNYREYRAKCSATAPGEVKMYFKTRWCDLFNRFCPFENVL